MGGLAIALESVEPDSCLATEGEKKQNSTWVYDKYTLLVHLTRAVGVKSDQLAVFLAAAWPQQVKVKVRGQQREGHSPSEYSPAQVHLFT